MTPLTRVYYAIKPWLPDWLRFALRRRRARAIRRGGVHNWPINPAAARPPAGWMGWPEGKKFAVVLTHDVEGQHGLDQVLQLADLERALGFRSSFNLIPEGAYEVPPALRQELTDTGFEVGVHDLHHDGKLYHSRREFSRRARRINHYLREWQAVGFRSAYMLHNLDWIRDLDIAYDASTFDTDPFEPQPDGVGTIFPFWVPRNPNPAPNLNLNPPPHSRLATPSSAGATVSAPPLRAGERAGVRCSQSDLRTPQPCRDGAPSEGGLAAPGSFPLSDFSSPLLEAGFLELPYTLVQDSTLFLILGEQGIDCWQEKVRWIADHGGMVLVNVHPDYLRFNGAGRPYTYPACFYRELLEFLTREYAGQFWHVLPREVAGRFSASALRSPL
jgi:hypothetical protein